MTDDDALAGFSRAVRDVISTEYPEAVDAYRTRKQPA